MAARGFIQKAAHVAPCFLVRGPRMLLRIATIVLLSQAVPVVAQSTGSDTDGPSDISSSTRGVVRGNGLETRVLFLGTDFANNRLALSVRITNTGDTSAYLALAVRGESR